MFTHNVQRGEGVGICVSDLCRVLASGAVAISAGEKQLKTRPIFTSKA